MVPLAGFNRRFLAIFPHIPLSSCGWKFLVIKFAILFSVDPCLLVFLDLEMIPDLVYGLFPLGRAHAVSDHSRDLKIYFFPLS